VAEARGRAVETDIEDFTGFTLAEDYHQKYRLRRIPAAIAEYEAMFPTTEAFLGSVAVTKANAFVGGYGTSQDLRSDDPSKGKLGQLGLTGEAQASVLKAAR
jgi:peptide-methionine (S)-S-oxide reductase